MWPGADLGGAALKALEVLWLWLGCLSHGLGQRSHRAEFANPLCVRAETWWIAHDDELGSAVFARDGQLVAWQPTTIVAFGEGVLTYVTTDPGDPRAASEENQARTCRRRYGARLASGQELLPAR